MNTESCNDILFEKRDKLLIIKFNRPHKKNAFNDEIYYTLPKILREAATDDNINVLALTGVGDFYSSGNDLSVSLALQDEKVDFDDYLKEKKAMIIDFIRSFYEFPKLLIAVVNGPCIGIAATTAALCDIIYCSNTSYFLTPFSKLALCAEGGSSYIFPKILGKSKAMEMLLCGHKLQPTEALNFNFVSEVFNANEIESIWLRVYNFSNLPIGSVKATKKLVYNIQKDELEKAVLAEADALQNRWNSNEFFEVMSSYFKSKM